MEYSNLTPREELEFVYALAFFPPQLHYFWGDIKKGVLSDKIIIKKLLKKALLLHRALPETGYQSKNSLKRIAIYQANSKPYKQETFMKNILKYLGIDFLITEQNIPGNMIRDIGLPKFERKIKNLNKSKKS